MVFPVGWPQRVSTEQSGGTLSDKNDTEHVVDMVKVAKKEYLVVLTSDMRIVFFHSKRSPVIIASYKLFPQDRAESSVSTRPCILVHAHGHRIITRDAFGRIYCMDVIEDEEKVRSERIKTQEPDPSAFRFQQRTASQHGSKLYCTQLETIQRIALVAADVDTFNRTWTTEEVCLHLASDGRHVVFVFQLPDGDRRLVICSWKGEVMVEISLDKLQAGSSLIRQRPGFGSILSKSPRGSLPLIHVAHSGIDSDLSMVSLVLEDGSLFVVPYAAEDIIATRFSMEDAVCASMNAVRHVLAVGRRNGDITLIPLTGGAWTVLSLAPWDVSAQDTGPVSDLCWTACGSALVVGWAKRGFSIWSSFGCRYMCSIPQLETAREDSTTLEPARHGVGCLALGSLGYQLFIADHDAKGVCKRSFLRYPLFKSSLTINGGLHHEHDSMLLAEDRIAILVKSPPHVQTPVTWYQSILPHAYFTAHGPPLHVAASMHGTHVALCSRRGLVLYNIGRRSWTMFGDIQEEHALLGTALAWYEKTVLVATWNTLAQQARVRAYPSHLLANHALECDFVLPVQNTKILKMSCTGSTLLILTQTSVLLYYSLQRSGDRIVAKLSHHIALSYPAHDLRALIMLPDGDGQCVVLHGPTGRLTLCRFHRGEEKELAPCSVDACWVGGATSTTQLQDSIWAYGIRGVELWLNQDGSEPLALLGREESGSRFDLDVYPIGFVPESDVILGMTHGVSPALLVDPFQPGASLAKDAEEYYPYFEYRIALQPFMHAVLTALLSSNNMDDAHALAESHVQSAHFAHTMELLVHDTLTKEMEKMDHQPTLDTVLTFCRRFPQFPRVMVTCARKTDPAEWPVLFQKFAPGLLFQECMDSYQIQVAATYLRVLQVFLGPKEAKKYSFQVLESLLWLNDLNTISDLQRFLEPGQSLASAALEAPSVEDEDEDDYTLEILLARYAKKLIRENNFRGLLQFSRCVGRDIRMWLRHERNRAARIVRWKEAFEQLHHQFGIPFQPEVATPTGRGIPVLDTAAGFRSSLTGFQADEGAFADLSFLLNETLASQCYEWSLLFATILQNLDTAVEVLREHPSLSKPYFALMGELKMRSARDFCARVRTNLSRLEKRPLSAR